MQRTPTSIDHSTKNYIQEILEFEARPDFEQQLEQPEMRDWYDYARQRVEEDLAYHQHLTQANDAVNAERLEREYELALANRQA